MFSYIVLSCLEMRKIKKKLNSVPSFSSLRRVYVGLKLFLSRMFMRTPSEILLHFNSVHGKRSEY